MPVTIKDLCSYRVAEDGAHAELTLEAIDGETLALQLDVAQMGMLVMTLPRLIEASLRRRHKDASLRFSYPMGSWTVEQASDPAALILTLKTTDGFGISFTVPAERQSISGVTLRARAAKPYPR